MRVMVLVKATKESEAGVMPTTVELSRMMEFNEKLVKAGVMLAGDGLHPSSKAVRVGFSGSKRTVIDGPFTETKELVAGYWIWKIGSLDEAVEWAKQCPFESGELEIRPIFSTEDFEPQLTPELKEREERLGRQISGSNGG